MMKVSIPLKKYSCKIITLAIIKYRKELHFSLLFCFLDEEEESSTEEDESNVEDIKCDKVPAPDKVAPSAKETEAGAEISALVNYVQPVHFNSFESAESTFICVYYSNNY